MPMDMPDLNELFENEPFVFEKANTSMQKGPTITGFQPVHHAGLVALVEVKWPDGREEKEIRYYRDDNRRWVTPAIRFVGQHSYWLTTFSDFEAQSKYKSQVLAAIDAYLAGGDGHVG